MLCASVISLVIVFSHPDEKSPLSEITPHVTSTPTLSPSPSPIIKQVEATINPTPVETSTPTPVPFVITGEVKVGFYKGWHDAGGSVLKDDWSIYRMINCESTWRVITEPPFLGLAQFEEGTWESTATITGFWDWTDPYHQGFNTATWATLIDPGSSAGWPTCWFA